MRPGPEADDDDTPSGAAAGQVETPGDLALAENAPPMAGN